MESRPQEGGGIAQALATWPEGASAPNGTVKCRGHGVPEMVTPAMRTAAVLLGFLKLISLKFSMKCRGHGVPEMVTPAMRTTAVLLSFLNLPNMPCLVLP